MNATIFIIGCGWLGLPLAKHFIANGQKVRGSTTTESKLDVLASEGIQPHLLQLSAQGVLGDIDACLNNCKTLILNIPPRLRKHPEQDYVGMMQQLLPHVEKSSVECVLLIGSTSVYSDEAHFPIISEKTKTSDSETSKKLVLVEKLFQKSVLFKTTVLRFGGLIGPDRHPAKFLTAKKHLKNPKAPVNLIAQQDCIAIIHSIIDLDIWDETINAVFPSHPTREKYYTRACKAMNLPVPHFDHKPKSKGKIIDSKKLVQLLNYRFEMPI